VPESAPAAYDGVPRRRHPDHPVGSEDGKRTVEVITGLEGRGEVRHVPRHTQREAKGHLHLRPLRWQHRIVARAHVPMHLGELYLYRQQDVGVLIARQPLLARRRVVDVWARFRQLRLE